MVVVFSLILILIVPALLTILLVMLEPFAIVDVRIVLLCVGWGIISFLIADVRQSYQINVEGDNGFLVVALADAPVLEELLKFAFLLLIYNLTLARYAGDGLVYGFAIGSSFGAVENVAYLLAQPDLALGIALSRIVSAGFFHASLAGIMGAVVCGMIFYRRWVTYPVFVVLFLASVIVHQWFNIFAFLDEVFDDITDVIFIGVGLLIFNFVLMYWIRFWHKRRLLKDMQDELNPTERMLLHHGEQVMDDLSKQRSTLGDEQVKLLQTYLTHEAHLAFLTHQTIKGRGHRPNIRKLRGELPGLKARLSQVEQQLSPAALKWLQKANSQS